jgi:hypothetical protein
MVMSSLRRRNLADMSAIWGLPPGIASLVFIIFESICRMTSFNSGFCQDPRWWAFTSVLLFSFVSSPVALLAGILLLVNKHERDIYIKSLALFGIVAGALFPTLAVLLHQGIL